MVTDPASPTAEPPAEAPAEFPYESFEVYVEPRSHNILRRLATTYRR